MKKVIDGILVVEGKTDVAFLSEFIDAEFVTTNGSDVPQETINYLKKSSEKRDIFVLTDPDSPGKRIRDILDSQIPGLNHCFVNKENCIKNKKVGVAESTKEEVLRSLSQFLKTDNNIVQTITQSDLHNLGLEGNENSSQKRQIIINKFNLGYCNAKTFLKRINYSKISYEELKNSL